MCANLRNTLMWICLGYMQLSGTSIYTSIQEVCTMCCDPHCLFETLCTWGVDFHVFLNIKEHIFCIVAIQQPRDTIKA